MADTGIKKDYQWRQIRYVHKGGIVGIQHVMEFEMTNWRSLGVNLGGKHVIAQENGEQNAG